MAELYAKPFETIETGYNPQQPQGQGQQSEVDEYINSLPVEEREAAMQRINAPLTGEELAQLVGSGQKRPTLQEYAEIEKWHKSHEISFMEGLSKIAEGGAQVMEDLSNAVGSFLDKPMDSTQKMPSTAVEAFAQGTRNFYGMMAQSQNPDSVLFRVKDFLNGTGTIEDRYNQYMEALEFNRQSAELAEGKQTLVMDKDMINHEVTQAMAYIADPTLFIPFGKVASTGLRAVGLGEKLAMAGAKAAAIKNGIIGNTLKWGAGQPLEFLGGAVRNTIDYGLEKAGSAFEATTGIGAKEFAQTARMSGVGFSASAIAGHAVPYASTLSDAYIVGSSAKGFGEALTLIGETMSKNKFGRGINSWAKEALDQAEKNGVALSPHAKGLLKTLNAVDPLFAYGWNGLETAAEGSLIGGGLGYLSGGEEGMYSGIGAGIALGAVGGTAGKVVADVTGGTGVARRAVQAKMVIEGHKVTNPDKAMFFQAMQTAAEARGQDVDLVNGIIAGIDNVAPNFEFHAMTPEQFVIEAERKGYNPITGKFAEKTALDHEFGGDRASKSKAMYILRSVGGDFVGNSKGFLEALKKASAKDSANPNKPAGNIPLNLRKYIDVAKTFDKLTKTQRDAILKEIDGQADIAKELGGSTKLREHYDALSWAEAWTDSVVKKFESDREGARKDITDMLAQETKKDGKMTKKGRALVDKLRAEGFLDKEGKLLQSRNLLNADMTFMQFYSTKGGVMRREADGKTHMYINLSKMGDETFPHELFHTIMRESPMKKHFTDSLIGKLIGTFDAEGNLVRNGEVNIGQVRKFFKKYIDLTSFNEDDGQFNPKKAKDIMDAVDAALLEYEQAGTNKKISDNSRSILEHYSEEFGAYYFSHWLMGRNRNTLFFGGELKGIEGLVERTKDAFLDFWQSKISKANPEFDFSRGLNEAFNRAEGLGRISSMDYFMRDMVRAASNANREVFRPDSMTLENLRDFERSNGLRNLTTIDGNRRLNPREQVTQNIRLGKEAYKILSGLDKNLRTSKDTVDENGKPVITGRLSEAELDALVKGGIVPRAWSDKLLQGYAMLDGTISNIFSAGYLGKTEQVTDASWPRKTGKDVAFKNRKAVLFAIDTKIKADGTFYSLFHTLDLGVIEQRGNHLWQDVDYRKLWNGERGAMEADFFAYISNASKASTDITKQDSAALLDKGDGLGARRRDVLHQMAGMALQTGDAYKHQPIAVIPEGIRHSVTTFNLDGLTMPRVENGARYDIDMGNAHKFIRENWQPDDMRQENTPNGKVFTHESKFKFIQDKDGKTTAYTSAGAKIGTYSNLKDATNAGKVKFNEVYRNHDLEVKKVFEKKNEEAKSFQALESFEREEAIRNGDLFSLQRVKDFIANRKVIRQTREEFIISKAQEALESPELFEKAVDDALSRHKGLLDEYSNVIREINNANNEIVRLEDTRVEVAKKLSEASKERAASLGTNDYSIIDNIYNQLEALQFEIDKVRKTEDYLVDKKKRIKDDLYRQNISSFASQYVRFTEQNRPFDKEAFIDGLKTTVKNNIAPMEGLANGGMQRTAHSSIQGTLFAHDFDSQFKTGQPIVVIGTHGTKNAELMLSRILLDSKLGTRYGVAGGGKAYSSDLGHFMGGSTDTSSSYAKNIDVVFKKGAFDAMHLSDLLGLYSFNNATPEARYYKSSLNQYAAHVQEQVFFKLDRVEAIAKKLVNDDRLSQEQKSELNLEAIAILDFLQTRRYIDNEYKAEALKSKLSNIYSAVSVYGNANPTHFLTLKYDIETVKKGTNVLAGIKIDPNDIIKDRPSDEQIVHSLFAEEKEPAPFAVKDSISDPSEKIKFGDKEIDFPLSQQLYNNLINDTRQLMMVTADSALNKIRTQAKLIKEGNKYVSGLNAKGFPSSMILLPKMQLRMMMAFDNPKVIIDPRGYDESTIAPQMIQAKNEGHDGVIFKRFADGGDMDDVYIQLKGNQDNILTIDSSLDPQHIPRKDEQGNTLKTGRDLKLSLQPDEPNAPKQVKGIQLDMTKAYDVFRQEYEESTGQSWSQDKFMQRARNWQFFGDENGFVAVRPQRSGFVKLVGMAGDNKSKLRGIQQIQQQGLPIWGMVSKEIKDMAIKRGMREPNMIERTVLKQALNSAALGDAEILGYTSDNGVRIRYPDIGEVVKYMIGSPEYYQKLRSDFGDQIKSKIGFQPDDAGFGFEPNSRKASKLLNEYLYGLKTGKSHQEMITPELDYIFNNIESFTKASNDDIVEAILKLGSNGDAIVGKLQNKEITLKQAVEEAKNIDQYTYLAKLKDIRDARKGLYNAFMRATGQMRKISDKDGRRYNTEGEREHRDTTYQPDEPSQGGRVYDQNSRQFKTGFIGKWAEDNKELLKGFNIEFIDRGGVGGYRNPNAQNVRIRLQDNSKKGNTVDVGHITAQIDHRGRNGNGIATLSTSLDKAYRGRKLSYALYSEMAERLRSMGVKYVDGMIVNPEGIPIKVREKIIGDTRMIGRDGSFQNARPISQEQGSKIIKRKQASGGEWEGIDVVNELDFNARYQPDEPSQGGRTYTEEQFKTEFIGRVAAEDPDLTEGLRVKATNNDVRLIDNKGKEIGKINTYHDAQDMISASGESWIDPSYRGMGYGKLLYSEMIERLRAQGKSEFRGMIADPKNRPIRIRDSIVGNTKYQVFDTKTKQHKWVDSANLDVDKWTSGVSNKLDPNAWYQPDERIGTQSSNIKLLLEGMASGRILRTSSYKGLGLEDANLIAHTPDTAKIGQVTAGDKALADLQGGIFYAIANGKKIWASNFAGEGETNILVQFANNQIQQNPNGKTYIMLVKADNSKIFASVDGARGVSNIFKHLNDSGVMTDLRYSKALKNSAEMHLKMKGLDGLSKDELYSRIDDALLRSKENKISFENRAEFTREIARQLNEAGAFDSKKSKDALIKSFHKGFERGFSIVEMERVFGNLMAEDIIKDVPKGHVYGAIEITSPLKETKESNHRGYDASIEQESGEPAKLIMFDRTAHVTEVVNKKTGEEISMFKAGEGAYHSYTGGQIPYQEVRGRSKMPFQPAEYTQFTTEQTAAGRILKNAKGYVIIMANNKFRVYNPAKVIIGVFADEEQAKKRILKEMPKQ